MLHTTPQKTTADAVLAVRDALAVGTLDASDLTARKLSAFLGKTTSVLYHHWGSLNGFLFAVSQAGFERLAARLGVAMSERLTVADIAQAFVAFGLEEPGLYRVMFERAFDWEALRAAGAFDHAPDAAFMWDGLVGLLEAEGSTEPETDARILWAGLHGLISLALSGRANYGALNIPDRQIALDSARRLADRLTA